MTIDDRLTTLDELWSAWAERGRAMTDEQWQRPTRLGDWDVRSLYAHAGSWPWMLSILIDRVRDTEPTHVTAAALLQDFNAPNGIAHRGRDNVAAGAREDAAGYSTAQMVEQFAGSGPRAIATARQLGPVVVDYFGRALLRLDEAVSIGIVEATVHLLDLQRALGQPPEVPVEGLTHTAAVIVQMAPPVDFIEAATGRGTTDLFPVLS
ncbi:maleylpyruvate isomerase family mycothiol-dependent enzyme [Dactylosporangium sp. NPDC005555]|uniref:maleylpyruvate isomerase family mycothiol-dependent enzyme n=1 Tax=Dactylosporangium sp. NPDC005555 TaxID=3154889 RepID=UPI0033A43778